MKTYIEKHNINAKGEAYRETFSKINLSMFGFDFCETNNDGIVTAINTDEEFANEFVEEVKRIEPLCKERKSIILKMRDYDPEDAEFEGIEGDELEEIKRTYSELKKRMHEIESEIKSTCTIEPKYLIK